MEDPNIRILEFSYSYPQKATSEHTVIQIPGAKSYTISFDERSASPSAFDSMDGGGAPGGGFDFVR